MGPPAHGHRIARATYGPELYDTAFHAGAQMPYNHYIVFG